MQRPLGSPNVSPTAQLMDLGSSLAAGPGAEHTTGMVHSWRLSTPHQSAPAWAMSTDGMVSTTCCGAHGLQKMCHVYFARNCRAGCPQPPMCCKPQACCWH